MNNEVLQKIFQNSNSNEFVSLTQQNLFSYYMISETTNKINTLNEQVINMSTKLGIFEEKFNSLEKRDDQLIEVSKDILSELKSMREDFNKKLKEMDNKIDNNFKWYIGTLISIILVFVGILLK